MNCSNLYQGINHNQKEIMISEKRVTMELYFGYCVIICSL